MSKLSALSAAAPDVRAETLALLDQVSAPLTVRQLDRIFQEDGMTRSQARRMTRALKHLHVIAVVPKL